MKVNLAECGRSKIKAQLGIDPGRYGCACVIGQDELTLFHDYESNIVDTLRNIRMSYDIQICVIEEQFWKPPTSRKSVASIFKGYGEYIGAMKALDISFIEVPPKEWQKGLGVPTDRKERKLRLIEIACNLAPNADIRITDRSKLENFERTSGRADAYLIAQHGTRYLAGL